LINFGVRINNLMFKTSFVSAAFSAISVNAISLATQDVTPPIVVGYEFHGQIRLFTDDSMTESLNANLLTSRDAFEPQDTWFLYSKDATMHGDFVLLNANKYALENTQQYLSYNDCDDQTLTLTH